MTTKYFIGGDISKSKIDFALLNGSLDLKSEQIVSNRKPTLLKFLKKEIKSLKITATDLVVCCENTGIYSTPLIQACLELGVFLWVENALKIKRASTDMRGKTDRQDARRIAEYACRYLDKAKAYQEPSDTVKELQRQSKIRETLISQRVGLESQIREAKTHDKALYDALKKGYASVLKQIERSLAKVDERIKELSNAEEAIKHNIELLTSIQGVGLQTALGFILYTNNFENYENAKHLACYSGVVPFANESGTIQKRARVSHMSNHRLKRLLHLAAMSAIRANKELKAYYLRKVKEGKNKMSVLNAVRNKLVHRMFAVVQRQTAYIQELNVPIKMEQIVLAS